MSREDEHQQRQADALSAIAEELRYQNAVLTELTRAVYTVAEQTTTGKNPEEPPITAPGYKRLQRDIEDSDFTRQKDGNFGDWP